MQPAAPVGFISHEPIVLKGEGEKLGEGTYGSVYGYEGPKGPFVVKYSTHDLDGGLDDSTLFEMVILAAMRHPNVVRLLDAFATEKAMALVLPRATRSLADHIAEAEEKGGMPLDDVRFVTLQLARGIAYVESRDVLNADYKPANVLIYDDEPSCRLHIAIADFGIARTSRCFGRRPDDAAAFTLWYRAPELLLGGGLTTAADSWALGCMLVEMLTGKPPFAGSSEQETLFLILLRLGVPDEESWPGVTALPQWNLKRIEKGMAKAFKGQKATASRTGFALDRRYARTQGGKRTPIGAPEAALANALLVLDPKKRLGAREVAEEHSWLDGARPRLKTVCLEAPPLTSTDCEVALRARAAPGPITPFARQGPSFPRSSNVLYAWLLVVCDQLALSTRTLGLTLYVLERYCTERVVALAEYQLVGLAALHVAGDLVEPNPVRADDLTYLSRNAYTIAQLARAERDLLGVVGVDLLIATSIDLLDSYASTYGEDARANARAFLVLSYFTGISNGRSVDLVALACLLLGAASAGVEFKQREFALERHGRQALSQAVGALADGLALVLDQSETVRKDVLGSDRHGRMSVRAILKAVPALAERLNPAYLVEPSKAPPSKKKGGKA